MLSPDSHLGANISVIRHRACQIQYENFYLLFNWIGQWSKNKEYAEFGRSSLDMYFNPFQKSHTSMILCVDLLENKTDQKNFRLRIFLELATSLSASLSHTAQTSIALSPNTSVNVMGSKCVQLIGKQRHFSPPIYSNAVNISIVYLNSIFH